MKTLWLVGEESLGNWPTEIDVIMKRLLLFAGTFHNILRSCVGSDMPNKTIAQIRYNCYTRK